MNTLLTTRIVFSLLTLFAFTYHSADGQMGTVLDSLETKLRTAADDSTKVRIMYDIGIVKNIIRLSYWDSLISYAHSHGLNKMEAEVINKSGVICYYQGDFDEAIAYFKKSLGIFRKMKHQKGIAQSYNNLGLVYHAQGENEKGIESHLKSKRISTQIKDREGIANSNNNLGLIYSVQGNIPEALDFFHKALKLYSALKYDGGMSHTYNNLGNIYQNQKDYPISLEYYEKSLKLRLKVGDKNGIASSYSNLANVYDAEGDWEKAMEYYRKSLTLREQIGDKRGIANSNNNLGYIYQAQGDTSTALLFYNKSLAMSEEIGNKDGISIALANIAGIELNRGNHALAKKYSRRALALAVEIGVPERIEEPSYLMYEIHKKEGNYKVALEMYELYITNRDSVVNAENLNEVVRAQAKYKFEKEQIINENAEKEKRRLEQEKVFRRNRIQYSGIFMCVLLIFGLVLTFGYLSISTKMVEGALFIAFLLLFEFLMVVLDPYTDALSDGVPIYKLGFNAILAIAIFPLTKFMEKQLKKRILKKAATMEDRMTVETMDEQSNFADSTQSTPSSSHTSDEENDNQDS